MKAYIFTFIKTIVLLLGYGYFKCDLKGVLLKKLLGQNKDKNFVMKLNYSKYEETSSCLVSAKADF